MSRVKQFSRRALVKAGLVGYGFAFAAASVLAQVVAACSGESDEDDDDDDGYGYGRRGGYGGPFGSRPAIGPNLIRRT